MAGLALLAALLIASAGCHGGSTASAGWRGGGAVDTIRVLVYNIHHGEGTDGRLDLERIGAVIAATDPDLVALQEVDVGVARTGGVDQAETLARLTGLHAFHDPFMEYQGGAYGMALLSRLPVEATWSIPLPPGPEPRTALAARVRLPDTGLRLAFVGIHFYRTAAERLAQARALAAALADEPAPVVLAGDFNSLPDSDVMAFLSSRWTVADKDGSPLTFPAPAPEREIDYVLTPPRVRVLEHRVLSEPVASDHRPLLAVLVAER